MFTLNFRNKVWTILRPTNRLKHWSSSQYGECHHKRNGDMVIRLLKRKTLDRIRGNKPLDLIELDGLIHEALHGMQWDLSEEAVSEFGELLSELLYKCGYRYNDQI